MARSVLFLAILSSLIFSQTRDDLKVIKVLESNQLLLSDSSVVKLAFIEIPSIFHSTRNISELGKEANAILHQTLIGTKINIERINDTAKVSTVIIQIPRNFYSVDPAKRLLQRGLAKIISQDTSLINEDCRDAENYAMENKIGIWALVGDPMYNINLTEEIKLNLQRLEMIGTPKITFYKIGGEFLIGTLGGVAGAAGGMLITAGLGGHYGIAFVCGALGVVIVGSSGVYSIARSYDPNLSFAPTFVAGLIGGGLGLLFARGSMKETYGLSAFIIMPFTVAITSMIYTNLLSPSLNQKAITPEEQDFLNLHKKNHAALYNSKKIVEIEIFRLNF